MKAIEDEDQRRKYTDIIEEARVSVLTELKNKGLINKIDVASEEYREMLANKSEQIITDTEHKLQRAEKIRQANLKREKEELARQEEILKRKQKDEEDWERSRQERVSSWKAFNSRKRQRDVNEHVPIKPPKTVLMN